MVEATNTIKTIGKVKIYLNQKLRQGMTATVYKGTYKQEGGKRIDVAVKCIEQRRVRELKLDNMLN